MPDRLAEALREHWPEYAIEAFALGAFMMAAAAVTTAFEYPASPLHEALPGMNGRRVLIGIAMGVTAVCLIYSPWGRRSGAHMNPAVTLSFLRLGKTHGVDAFFFVLAQFLGGTLGVLLAAGLLGPAFTAPPVNYAATLPGAHGPLVAFAAEVGISAALMFVVLRSSSVPRLAPFTGLFAGSLVATWIAVEAPLSGMSMNPARSFASAVPAGHWQHLWIYFTAPPFGMFLAVELHRFLARGTPAGCAKLRHTDAERCIHCGYEPTT